MLIAIDVGNTQIYIGVFEGDKIKASFRRTSAAAITADELGVFIKQALRENGIDPTKINAIAISSVVPVITRSIVHCALKYFNIKPFVVNSTVKMGLNLAGIPGASEMGADRIADIEGALHLYPAKNVMVVDFGSANTFCAVSKDGKYLGGAISAGIGMSMNALANGTALLSNVEIKNPGKAAGMDTVTQLQAGLFYTGLASIKEICGRLKQEVFPKDDVVIIGTGGLGRLYEDQGVFDAYIPDLVLIGLRILAEKNKDSLSTGAGCR